MMEKPSENAPRAAQIGVSLGRQIMRLSQGFFIDVAKIHSYGLGLELGQTLAFLSIKWANVEDLTASWEPRQPITVFAIAQRLNLPYETVRRHVGALIDADLCLRVQGGVQVRPDIYSVPGIEVALDEITEVTRRYVQALSDAGVPMPKAEIAGHHDPHRRIPQKAIHHFLVLAGVSHAVLKLDMIDALLFMSVIKANTWHLTADPKAAQAYASIEAIPPDDLRRPVTVYALAKQLALPYDTASRHAKKLLKAELCARDARGALIVPVSVLSSPTMMSAVHQVSGEVDRFLNASARVQRLPY
jgi:predicted transcriptional regulator